MEDDPNNPNIIITVHGVGYDFAPDLEQMIGECLVLMQWAAPTTGIAMCQIAGAVDAWLESVHG
jgi:predicted esterase